MAPADPKLALLKSIPLFARLDSRELQRLGQLFDEVDVPAGRVLMQQGHLGGEVFVLASGGVRVERNGIAIADRGPGDVIGEIALLSEGPRTATVTTTEPCRLLVLGHREFHSLMDEQPALRLQILEGLAGRIRALEGDAVH
ncbi:MAG: cyclic nucleotide-binding domain-containing protein [Chloroflexi bacterium]|nr:cyclic nucleotide-binding domain-containing protein [Chloroflexota bacterium]